MISVIFGSNNNPTAVCINQTYLKENKLSVFAGVVWVFCMLFVVFILKTSSLLVQIKPLWEYKIITLFRSVGTKNMKSLFYILKPEKLHSQFLDHRYVEGKISGVLFSTGLCII